MVRSPRYPSIIFTGLLLFLLFLSQEWSGQATFQRFKSAPFSPSSLQDVEGGNHYTIPIAFAEITRQVGILPERKGDDRLIGQAWGDVDNDGWLDLYVTDSDGPNILYRNKGDGSFEESPLSEAVRLPSAKSSGAVFADYDDDGWLDLYVLNKNEANVLFHNTQGETFTDVTMVSRVGDTGHGKTAAWGDYDQDGFLDLYVANWSCSPDCGRPTEGDRDGFYHNNGDGTFTDVTRILGSKVRGAGFSASFLDYDNDGDPDIYLVNDEFINPIGNALWRNDGPGCDGGWCFTEVSAESSSDTRVMGMGLASTDYDNDGDIDFYFSNAGPMALLQNQGDGTFVDVANLAGVDLEGNGIGWGAVFLDFDNDGFRDLYLALTDRLPDGQPINPLFRNHGDGSFREVEVQSGLAHSGKTLGVAYADYDNDGWVDLVIGNYNEGYALYRNLGTIGSGNHRISIRLVGGGPVNRDAIGARVYVRTIDGRTQMQEVQCGSSLGAGNATILYFGLGESQIETLTIRWPDGLKQEFERIFWDRFYTFEYPNS